MLVLNLVSEHVHEFYASRFQDWQVVYVLAWGSLELRDDQLLQVVSEQGLVDQQLSGTVSVGVDRDAGSDDQVEHGHLFLPLLCFVLFVLLLELREEFTDESANFIAELLGELLYKLHAVAPSCLRVRLFKVVSEVHMGLILVLIDVLLGQGDVRDH